MAGIKANRQEALRDFVDHCDRVGFHLEPFQKKVAGALLGPEREKVITLPRKNGKSRLVGTFAAWHLLSTPNAQAYIAANSEEQARIVFEYARAVALHPAVDQEFEVRYRELRRPDGGFLRVRAADAGKLLGLTPTLAVLDEYCAAKDDSVYTALRSALLPGATMFTITTGRPGSNLLVAPSASRISRRTSRPAASGSRRSRMSRSGCL
jgi:phage terminase large subunit-like protein